jgi:hypothetical protein
MTRETTSDFPIVTVVACGPGSRGDLRVPPALPAFDRLHDMRSKVWTSLLAAAWIAAGSSGCYWDQYNHSVRRMWVDYNSFLAPSISFEQVDHLPYWAPQVGYYRWMYDKDPGHQLAALGPVTPPANCVPQIVPPGDNPFDYQVDFPNAIPHQTDPLWGENQPEPINVLQVPADGANRTSPAGKNPQQLLTVPMAPVMPRTDGDKSSDPSRPTGTWNRSFRQSVEPPGPPLPGLPGSSAPFPGSPMPGFDAVPTPPKPVDEDAAPMLGPEAQSNPSLRLTTGSPTTSGASAATANSANSLWPR